MKLKMLLLSAATCLPMMTGEFLWAAQPVQPAEPQWLTQMYQEGWRKAQAGVLERETRGGKRETLSYGTAGLQWVVQGYEEQVEALEHIYSRFSNAKLADVIDQLRGEIDHLQSELRVASAKNSLAQETIEDCPNSSFGGDAYAGPQSGAQGVTATARAYFHNDCGLLGDTFAWAYAHAANGTLETTNNQSDPKNGGTWLDSYATASANGSTQCESKAQAAVTFMVNGEMRYFQTPYAQNFSCPSTESTSRYTLDSTAWEQTGTGNFGPLALYEAAPGNVTLIDRNYVPIATSGLPQAGIAFAKAGYSGAKLEGQPVDTVSVFANASAVTLEFTGRVTRIPVGSTPLMGITHFDDSTYASDGGTYSGVFIEIDPSATLGVVTLAGPLSVSSYHAAPGALIVNATTDDSFRWVWTEGNSGSSTGTGQWWRKMAGTWQKWGPSKPDLRRPIGHAQTRMRFHANQIGDTTSVGFDFLEGGVTLDPRPAQTVCEPQ